MIVSHEHRFIFLKTKKTAGSSLEIALSRWCGPDDVITGMGEPDEQLRTDSGGRGRQNNTSPPLVVPVRQHSGARRCLRAVGPDVYWSYFRFAVERNPWDAVVSLFYWVNRWGGEHQRSFTDFLDGPEVANLAIENYGTWHIHGKVAVDRVLRFESLETDLTEVWAQLGLPGSPELPRAKSGIRPSSVRYREMYDDAGRRKVGALFARTVDELSYTF